MKKKKVRATVEKIYGPSKSCFSSPLRPGLTIQACAAHIVKKMGMVIKKAMPIAVAVLQGPLKSHPNALAMRGPPNKRYGTSNVKVHKSARSLRYGSLSMIFIVATSLPIPHEEL